MNNTKGIKVFAPATVSNLGSGFDILGFPIEGAGDVIKVEKNASSLIRINKIECAEPLPDDPENNVASYAMINMLKKLNSKQGFDIELYKDVIPGSGIGSSASSSAAAVVAVNELLGNPFSKNELIHFAMEAEAMASGGKHADNVAPALLGGISLIRSYNPFEVITIVPPQDLWVVVLHPQMEIKTELSRRILPDQIDIRKAITQWGNVAGLISGFYTSDYELIGRSLEDVVVEPYRSKLIPGYAATKAAALKNGALGCAISGSGPSVFAFCYGENNAQKARNSMRNVYQAENIPFKFYVSQINRQGTIILDRW
ncbi:MAG: homoserine kinase [Bacteroidales bacterium]